MYRLIACDLDETLLNDSHEVSKEDIRTIERMGKMGIKFVLASGRGFNSMFPLLKQLKLYEKAGEYVISFNGAVITENRNSHIMSFNGLDFEKARELYKYGLFKGLCTHLYTLDHVFIYNYYDEEKAYVGGRMPIIEYFEEDVLEFRNTPIAKVLFMETDLSRLHAIDRGMGSLLEDIDVSYSSNRYIEFNRKGISKGNSLVHLAELLGMDISETVAVGDNLNDLSMISAAGLGVAVMNATDAVKAMSDVVLDCSNNESPITELFNKYIVPK